MCVCVCVCVSGAKENAVKHILQVVHKPLPAPTSNALLIQVAQSCARWQPAGPEQLKRT